MLLSIITVQLPLSMKAALAWKYAAPPSYVPLLLLNVNSESPPAITTDSCVQIMAPPVFSAELLVKIAVEFTSK